MDHFFAFVTCFFIPKEKGLTVYQTYDATLVPLAGFEPARPRRRLILSQVCLPVSTQWHAMLLYNNSEPFARKIHAKEKPMSHNNRFS